MRIAMLNCVCGIRSTGRIVQDIAGTLLAAGHSVQVYYSEGATDAPYATRYILDAERGVHAVLSRITGLQGYFSVWPTRRLLRKLDAFHPDVVHLHVLHGNCIHLPMLFHYLSAHGIPVVVTLHDFWMMTGKCTHPICYACDRFTETCHDCPALRGECPSLLFDWSTKMQRDRKKWFASLCDYRVIGVSRWITDEAKRSFLDSSKIDLIYNWIDRADFYPADAASLSARLDLTGRFVLLGVSTFWTREKGLDDFLALAAMLPEDDRIILVGNLPAGTSLPKNCIHIPETASVEMLRTLYAAADVFVNPSRFETFGKTTAEARCCGTPAVVYDNTAMPELVPAGCGYVVEEDAGVPGLLQAIMRIRAQGKGAFSEACVRYARAQFDKDMNLKQHMRIYEALCDGGQ